MYELYISQILAAVILLCNQFSPYSSYKHMATVLQVAQRHWMFFTVQVEVNAQHYHTT